ncbi:hypothetical protein GBA65_07420 [Rubrobacter marinus]|uniref:Uncharacterized protein n=1 Tax=Rubrobacter marinus TaxID=2653852 RepID=A0A6G8PVZ5_9ACTN|nr:hypothetical protein [Rubrobacter marinus]QIN78382.1 hypothetical protein GBA65_07420 [Rubrobacter marinus]
MKREVTDECAVRGGRSGRRAFWRLRLATLPVLLLAAQVLVACGSGEEPAPEAANMPVEDPSEYYGTMRAFGGEVGAVLGPDAFVMVEEADRAEGRYPEGVLVVNDTGRPLESELAVSQPVSAYGGVEQLQPGEAEEETGLQLDQEALEQYEGGPWMSATSVDVPEENQQEQTTR